jgi:O-antigen ligase
MLTLARGFLYLSLFSILLVVPGISVPFAGKYLLFRAAVELSLACTLLWWGFVAGAGEARRRLAALIAAPLFRAVTAFVLVFLAACLFADDGNAAFWSSYERGDGGFQMLHYFAFFGLLLFLLDEAHHQRLAARLFLIAAGIAIAQGVLAAALVGAVPLPAAFARPYLDQQGLPIASTFVERLLAARFEAGFGNSAFFSSYVLFAIALAVHRAVSRAGPPAFGRLADVAIVAVFVVFLLLTQTRGALLGLGAGAFAGVIYLALADERYRRRVALGMAVVAVIGIALFIARDLIARQDFVGHRLFEFDIRERGAQTRLWAWRAAWQGFLERPLLGWGPENFGAVFDRYLDLRFYVPGAPLETWSDRAHSVVFDYLVAGGIVGLMAYAAIFAAYYREFFRRLRRSPGAGAPRVPAAEQALFFAMPVAYLVQGLVFFDTIGAYLGLFFFLALSNQVFRWRR